MQGEYKNLNDEMAANMDVQKESASQTFADAKTTKDVNFGDIDEKTPIYEPKKNKLKTIASVFSMLFLVGGLAASVYLVQQQQEIRERASGICTVGITQCSGFDQVAECIPAGTECPTREGNEVFSYPSWCDIAKECSINEKCLEGACIQISEP
jgi:hypothetical protein